MYPPRKITFSCKIVPFCGSIWPLCAPITHQTRHGINTDKCFSCISWAELFSLYIACKWARCQGLIRATSIRLQLFKFKADNSPKIITASINPANIILCNLSDVHELNKHPLIEPPLYFSQQTIFCVANVRGVRQAATIRPAITKIWRILSLPVILIYC